MNIDEWVENTVLESLGLDRRVDVDYDDIIPRGPEGLPYGASFCRIKRDGDFEYLTRRAALPDEER